MHAQLTIHNPHDSYGSYRVVPLPQVHLEIIRGQAQSKVRQVGGSVFLIGCAPDCDLVLADPQFPAVHSYLFVLESRVVIRHLGAGPKLEVEGQTVKSTELHNGDHIRTGPYEFVIQIEVRKSATNEAALPRPKDSLTSALLRDVRAQVMLGRDAGDTANQTVLDASGDRIVLPRRAVA